jgi:hypothetical protein
MFMVRVYNEDGNRMWLDNGYIWDDIEALKPIVDEMGIDMPDVKMSIYKNRRGRYKDILLWCKSDRGTCRIDPLFVTRYNYELVEMQDFKIKITPRIEASAF